MGDPPEPPNLDHRPRKIAARTQDGVAHRLSRRLWTVPTKGSIRFHSPDRWDIYVGKKLVGFTRGPRGVPAGLMWLVDDPGLEGLCVVVVAPGTTTDNVCVEHYP